MAKAAARRLESLCTVTQALLAGQGLQQELEQLDINQALTKEKVERAFNLKQQEKRLHAQSEVLAASFGI